MLARILSRKLLTLIFVGSFFTLSGCATIPDAIKGTSPTPVVQLSMVQNMPSQFIGAEARFGGTVVGVTNERDRTVLEIATVPLDSSGRPILNEPSRGRILAAVNNFLDPIDFQDQLVTVVGPITGLQEGKIGSVPYRFVAINVIGFKRWQVVQQIMMPLQPIPPWGWYGDPWGTGRHPNDPFWRHPHRGPVRIQPLVTE